MSLKGNMHMKRNVRQGVYSYGGKDYPSFLQKDCFIVMAIALVGNNLFMGAKSEVPFGIP